MEKFILKNQKSLLRFLTIYFSFNLLLLFLGKYTSLVINRYYSLNLITYSLLTISFFHFFILIQKDKEYYKKKFEAYFKYGFLISLLLATIGSLKLSFIENIRFLEVIVKFLSTQSLIITILAIGLGFFSFYFNREKIGQEIEKEQENEKILEEKRMAEFASKFPKINKIPVFKNLLKWMHKEGWGYILSLIVITIFCIFLSIEQWSTIKGLWIDEWISLETARVYFSKNFPYFESGGHISYGYVYFLLLSIVDILFENYLHAGRILNLVFVSMAVPFLYLSIKKILNSKRIALLSILIFLTSPTTIYLINEVRSYVFSILLLSLIGYFIFVYNKNYFIKTIVTILLTILLIDNHITNIYFIAILVFIILIEKVFFKKDLSIKKLILVLISLFFLAIMAYKGNPVDAIKFYLGKLMGSSLPGWAAYKEEFTYPIEHLLNNVGAPIMFILLAVSYILFVHRYKILIYLLFFISIFILPISLSGAPNSFRYLFVIFPIYAAMLGFGINLLYYQFNNKRANVFLIILIVSMSIYLSAKNNIDNVPWAKTIDFENSWNKIKDSVTDDTLIMTNYMGIQLSHYTNIDKIIYDKQEFYFYENSSRHGKKNIFGWEYKATEGRHFILGTEYLHIDALNSLIQKNKKIMIIIRPWNSDINEDSFTVLKNIGFTENNSLKPLRLFMYELD